ncbi:MAG TPA: toprim domain-containing protein [Sphingobium sp.]|nr:toprim domain-containing protein [Sphingobium sp.]
MKMEAFSYNPPDRHSGGTMTQDAAAAFIAAMEAAGVRPAEPIADRLGSDLIRFACEGDGSGKRNGWAVLHLDERPAGAFGNYRLQVSETWRSGTVTHLSPAERRERAERYRAEKERRAAMRLHEQQEASARCRARWDRCRSADPRHPYLTRKRVSAEGLRQDGNRLLVPMFDAEGILWNLQAIAPDGSKRFAVGGRQAGLFCLLGDPGPVLLVGEGFATCAAVRRATGYAAAVAYSAANLSATAQAMASAYPAADLVILADDDAHLVDHPTIRKNVGLEAARAAALAVGGRLAIPPRKDDAA